MDRTEELLEMLRREFRDANSKPLVLTKRRAAQELSVGLTKLEQLIKGGLIIPVKIGAAKMIPMSEILRLATPKTRPAQGARMMGRGSLTHSPSDSAELKAMSRRRKR